MQGGHDARPMVLRMGEWLAGEQPAAVRGAKYRNLTPSRVEVPATPKVGFNLLESPDSVIAQPVSYPEPAPLPDHMFG